MTGEDVEQIVSDMRALGLDPGELGHRKWRTELDRRSPAAAPIVVQESEARRPRRQFPQVHQAGARLGGGGRLTVWGVIGHPVPGRTRS